MSDRTSGATIFKVTIDDDVLFGRGGGAKAAPKAGAKGGQPKTAIGAAVQAVVGGAGGGVYNGTVNGKKGFQVGNTYAKGRKGGTAVTKASGRHRAARNAVSKHIKAGTTTSPEFRASVKEAAAAHRELQAARSDSAAARSAARSAAAKASRAVASGRDEPLPARPAATTTPKPTIEARVKGSAKEASGLKADRAATRLGDLHAGARAGALKPTEIHAHVERIARGATKDELFAAAKKAGIAHEGIATKKALVEHLKQHAHGLSKPAEATKPAPAAAASKAEAPAPAPAKTTPKAEPASTPAGGAIPHTDTRQAAFVEHSKYIASEHAPHIETLAGQVGMTPSQYKSALDSNLKAVADHADAYVRVDSGTLPHILNDGRFKTQFETGTSNGSVAPEFRSKVESELFGTKADVAPEHRPVYGYLDRPGFASAGHTSQARIEGYGDAVVRLKPHVKDRATFTVGDSIARHDIVHGSPASRPDSSSLPIGRPAWARTHKDFLDPSAHAGDKIDRLTSEHGYIEAQYHGGIGHHDIAEVAFNHDPGPRAKAALEERGIPWRVTRTYHE